MGIFRTIHGIISIAFVVIVIVVVYALMLTYTVAKTSVTSGEITGVTNITIQGFTVNGKVLVANNGPLTLDIKEITYVISIADNETIANGTIPGFKVKGGENATFQYSQRISWTKSVALGLDVINGRTSDAQVNGEVIINHFGLYENKIPFKTSFSIKSYLTEIATDNLGQGAGSIIGNLTQLLGQYAKPN